MMKRTKNTLCAVMTAAVVLGGSGVPVFAKSVQKSSAGNGQQAKNVIVMVADGWGYNQILAANYYNAGKANAEAYQNFPVAVGMSTFSSVGAYDPLTIWDDFDAFKAKTTDSAAAGTAMSTGYKTYDAGIGVKADETSVTHIAEEFEMLGRATGVVSSVQFYHATPASFAVHDVNRNNYNQIAEELIRESALEVVMAPGHPGFNDDNEEVALNYTNLSKNKTAAPGNGALLWNDLTKGIAGADRDGDKAVDPWAFIETREEFQAMMDGDVPNRVFGVPQAASTLQQGRSGDSKADPYAVDLNEGVPTLAEMSKAALNVLDNDEDGLFLMIEGGAIDWAGHANQSGRVIEEMDDFNGAVDAVIDWVETNSSWSQTLLIVTGDHETGYLTGADGTYGEVVNNGAGSLPGMVWNSGDHTNQLIPMFAKGQGAAVLRKTADQMDPVRGRYMDNTEFFGVILDLIQ